MNDNFKIFLVDDDPICRELYRQYLLNIGFNDVHLFDNGQSCLQQLVQHPDIVLLDHQMQPINGIETLKKIKEFDSGIYVIYVSSESSIQIALSALNHGAFDYIIKGEHEEEMLHTLIHKITNVINTLSKTE